MSLASDWWNCTREYDCCTCRLTQKMQYWITEFSVPVWLSSRSRSVPMNWRGRCARSWAYQEINCSVTHQLARRTLNCDRERFLVNCLLNRRIDSKQNRFDSDIKRDQTGENSGRCYGHKHVR